MHVWDCSALGFHTSHRFLSMATAASNGMKQSYLPIAFQHAIIILSMPGNTMIMSWELGTDKTNFGNVKINEHFLNNNYYYNIIITNNKTSNST